MAKNLPPIPYSTPIADDQGLIQSVWRQWMQTLFDRVGGNIAPTNTELATVGTSAAAAVQANVNSLTATVTGLQTQIADLSGGLTQGRAL